MDTPHPHQLNRQNRRVPVVTLCLVGAALLVAAFPKWQSSLIYDRQAILAGELWRLYTGHWVHFSASHLAYDTLALGIVGGMLELRRPRLFGWLMLLAPWVINLLLMAGCPDLLRCGGLSGLATCALVVLALDGLRDLTSWRGVCWLALVAVGAKIMYESQTGHMIFADISPGEARICPASHLVGATTGLVLYGVWKARSPRQGLAAS